MGQKRNEAKFCGLLVIICLTFFLASCGNDKLVGYDVRIYKNTPVWDIAKAIQNDDTSQIKELLRGKPDSILNYKEKYFGQSLLNWAVFARHYPSVIALSELGANPNIQSNDGTSAFIQAADVYETSDYLKLLLKHGGDINAVAQTKGIQDLKTPLIAAVNSRRLENVKILLDAGANIDYSYTYGYLCITALYKASINDDIQAVHYLIIDKKADFKKGFMIANDGDTMHVVDNLRYMAFPLESIDYKMKMEVVEYLKERGVDYAKTLIPATIKDNYPKDYLDKY
jgi:ankyrin repeat protein